MPCSEPVLAPDSAISFQPLPLQAGAKVKIETVRLLCSFRVGSVQAEIVACENGAPCESGMVAYFEYGGARFAVRMAETPARPLTALQGLLTARELEIARLVAMGLRNKQIAHELGLSDNTVASYIKHICYKLQVHNRTAMVTRCSQLAQLQPASTGPNGNGSASLHAASPRIGA